MSEQSQTAARYVSTTLGAVLEGQGRMGSWLAGRVGVSESSVSKIVAGTRTVDRQLGEAIGAAVDVPFFVLFALRERSDNDASPEEAA